MIIITIIAIIILFMVPIIRTNVIKVLFNIGNILCLFLVLIVFLFVLDDF